MPTATPTATATPIPSLTPTLNNTPLETPTATPTLELPPLARCIVGYFVSWSVYERDYHVRDVPAEQLTHINYAFANISDAGECVLGDPFADIEKFYDETDDWNDPEGTIRGNFNQL